MILSISWKNVWRNKLRSSVVILAVTFGLFSAVFAAAVMVGAVEQRTNNLLKNELSHIQLHNPNYKANNEAIYTIENSQKIAEEIQKIPEVKAITQRIKMTGMINTSATSTGGIIYGINPDDEKQVTEIYNSLCDSAGTYFEKNKRNPVVIGEKLAKKLKLVNYIITDNTINVLQGIIDNDILSKLDTLKNKRYRNDKDIENDLEKCLGIKAAEEYSDMILQNSLQYKIRSKIIITTQGIDGYLVGGAFRVVGIYKTNNSVFDGMSVFVRNKDIASITSFDMSKSHEIAVLLNSTDDTKKVVDVLKEKYPDLLVESWGDLQPDLAMMSDYMAFYNYIFVIIILFALGFGIVNTMLMVVLERVKELGMLMAVGMNKMRVFKMIMYETIFLTLTGAIVGMLVSALAIWYWGTNGISLAAIAEGMEALGYEAMLYPQIDIQFYLGVTALVIFTGILASVYPARKALKLNPAEAIRIDL